MQTADIKDAVKLHTRNRTELAQFNKNNEYEIIIINKTAKQLERIKLAKQLKRIRNQK